MITAMIVFHTAVLVVPALASLIYLLLPERRRRKLLPTRRRTRVVVERPRRAA